LVAGTPIAEIFDPTDVFVDWYIPNERLADPKVGNEVFVLFGNFTKMNPFAICERSQLTPLLPHTTPADVGGGPARCSSPATAFQQPGGATCHPGSAPRGPPRDIFFA
jgi:hypothetical protein